MYQIGKVTQMLGLSADTLRYYEKISILPPIARTASGLRSYADRDLSRLKFVMRTQRMGFSLDEIGQLIRFREDPQNAQPMVRQMAQEKLAKIEETLKELQTLRDEFRLLINLCMESKDGCPILDGLE